MIQYWYKKQDQDKFINLSKYVTEHVAGNSKINDISINFEFGLSTPKDELGDFIDFFSSGDEIAITSDSSNTDLICHGHIIDDGSDIISWDWTTRDKPFFKFKIKCIEKDFSLDIIESITFADNNLSFILDEIMLFTNDSIGSSGTIPKYKINFTDFNVSAFTVEKKSPRDALTDLVDQLGCFFTTKYQIFPDAINNLKIIRYIEISNKDGISPSSNATWLNGINTYTVKHGVVENVIQDSKLKLLPAETAIKLQKDFSILLNDLELSAKVYSLNNPTALYRYTFPAEPQKFQYDLDSFAADIKYVAFLLRPSSDPVKILSGSTSTVVRIPTRYCLDIKTGDIAYFPDHNINGFYPVATITKINLTYTEVAFASALPFTPVTNDRFEIVSNIEIFEDDNSVDYASKGCIKQIQKNQFGKIKFLDLSEPPPGVEVSVFYIRLQDSSLKLKNTESIKKYGLKYREIKIDDDIVLNNDELNKLASKLLQIEPKLIFNTQSKRYGIPPVGLSIPININGMINKNFILQENKFKFLGVDSNKLPVFGSDLSFADIIGSPDQYIKALRRLTANQKKVKTNSIQLYKEKLSIIETISFSLNDASLLLGFSALPATNITANGFTAHWTAYTGSYIYFVEVSNVADFSTRLFVKQLTIITGSNTINLDISTVGYSGSFYYRVIALVNYKVAAISNIIAVIELPRDLVSDNDTLFYVSFRNSSVLPEIDKSNSIALFDSVGYLINPNNCSFIPSFITGKNTDIKILPNQRIYFHIEGGNLSNASPQQTRFTAKITTSIVLRLENLNTSINSIFTIMYIYGMNSNSEPYRLELTYNKFLNKFSLNIYGSILLPSFSADANYILENNINYIIQISVDIQTNQVHLYVNGIEIVLNSTGSITQFGFNLPMIVLLGNSLIQVQPSIIISNFIFHTSIRTLQQAQQDYNNLFG